MSNQQNTTTELAKWIDKKGNEQTVTIQNYLDLLKKKDDGKVEIADFIYQRLFTRYLKPFLYEDATYSSQYKNGFSIMANSCLLIETIQSFKNGWGDSDKKSPEAFQQFLKTESNFSDFINGINLYSDIRCGILHQGETKGGWKINRGNKKDSREPPKPLIDKTTKEINSIAFAKEVEKSLKKYSGELKNAEWDSENWDNFRTKMRRIIKNCQS